MDNLLLNLKFFGLGVLGQLIHIALKYRKVKASMSITQYLIAEWLNIFINLLCITAVILIRHDIPKVKGLEWVENTMSISMVFIGYSGQSLLVSLLSKLEKRLNDKAPE